MTDQPPSTLAAADLDDDTWVTARLGATNYRTTITTRTHTFYADEPTAVGGADSGPTPYDFLLGALAACMSMTLRMYAARKHWPLDDIVIRLRTARPAGAHAQDCMDCDVRDPRITRLERRIELHGDLSDDQRARLLDIADRCPLKRTLERGLEVASI